jgi:GrpB-like predicted nucleotidyltransferase (UPF0157 family)
MVDLRPGADFIDAANEILERERARLAGLIPTTHELLLVGGSSIPAALTKGDVDLHLRVAPPTFSAVVVALTDVYDVVHPEIWQPTLATFTVAARLPTGVAVTPAGSGHDRRFTRTWQRLAADPSLVAAYNTIKIQARADPDAYERRKSAFFDEVVRGGE